MVNEGRVSVCSGFLRVLCIFSTLDFISFSIMHAYFMDTLFFIRTSDSPFLIIESYIVFAKNTRFPLNILHLFVLCNHLMLPVEWIMHSVFSFCFLSGVSSNTTGFWRSVYVHIWLICNTFIYELLSSLAVLFMFQFAHAVTHF